MKRMNLVLLIVAFLIINSSATTSSAERNEEVADVIEHLGVVETIHLMGEKFEEKTIRLELPERQSYNETHDKVALQFWFYNFTVATHSIYLLDRDRTDHCIFIHFESSWSLIVEDYFYPNEVFTQGGGYGPTFEWFYFCVASDKNVNAFGYIQISYAIYYQYQAIYIEPEPEPYDYRPMIIGIVGVVGLVSLFVIWVRRYR